MLLNRGPNGFGSRLGSGNGGPAWLPEGAVAGVNYQEGEAYLFDTLITDLSTIHTDLDPTKVTAAGMAVTEANGHFPYAAGDFLNVFVAFDWCVVFDWDQLAYPSGFSRLVYADEDAGDFNNLRASLDAGSGAVTWCDGNNGQFIGNGTALENSRNKIAASANAAGWLASLNGATAVLDSPVTPTLTDGTILVAIGHNASVYPINGTIRSLIFYANEQDAATVEALSA